MDLQQEMAYGESIGHVMMTSRDPLLAGDVAICEIEIEQGLTSPPTQYRLSKRQTAFSSWCLLSVCCQYYTFIIDAVFRWMKVSVNYYLPVSLSVDIGNKIDEPGAEALLYALRDQATMSQSTPVIKAPSTGLLRLCIQVL